MGIQNDVDPSYDDITPIGFENGGKSWVSSNPMQWKVGGTIQQDLKGEFIKCLSCLIIIVEIFTHSAKSHWW